MTKIFSRPLLKQEGKNALVGNWPVAIVIMLIGAVGSLIISFISQGGNFTSPEFTLDTVDMIYSTNVDAGSVGTLALIGSILGILFSGAYQMAQSKWYLDIVERNPNVSIGDFFGHFSLVGKGILASLWMSLWTTIWMLIGIIPFAILLSIVIARGAGGSEPSAIFIILLILSVLVMLAIAIWKGISYSQMYNIIADHPEIGVRESMRLSIEITKDYLGELVMLGISFIGWILLTAVTCGLAAFYVQPYMNATYAATYFFLRDQALEKGLISPETFGLRRVEEEIVE